MKTNGHSKNYLEFLERKTQLGSLGGFKPLWIPDSCFDFQKTLDDWVIRKGRGAIFANCGLGKSLMELVWAENVVRHTNGRVLILTPLAVGHQFVNEGEKFGIECVRCGDGKLNGKRIAVTNYQRLHYFNPNDFEGVVADESGCLKNFDAVTTSAVTDFMRKVKYRLLGTATPSPNDYIELGTSSEALGELGFMDMIGMFFKKQQSTISRSDEFRHGVYRFRGHAERDFWRWVCSWSRAIRKPSDIGGDDARFVLPKLTVNQHVIKARTPNPEMLFDLPAVTLPEQRDERRRTIQERCEKAAELIHAHKGSSIAWCNLNDEGDLLDKLIKDCVQVSGSDSDEEKEAKFEAFEKGKVKRLVSKSSIAGWGLNWQHCDHQTHFVTHSFEQWYQSVRRSWRFGQKNPVTVDVISSEGESRVLGNMTRKTEAAEAMFANLVSLMSDELKISRKKTKQFKPEIPVWM